MNGKVTEIFCIIDKSGSMCNVGTFVVDAFNDFINHYSSTLPNEGYVSITLFDEDVHNIVSRENIRGMKAHLDKNSYTPEGGTALLDAIGQTLVKAMYMLPQDGDLNRNVIVAIITDGMDTSSEDFKLDYIKHEVERLTKCGWFFVFIGADIDAFDVAKSIGIPANNTMQISSNGKGVVQGLEFMKKTSDQYLLSRGGKC